MATNTSMSAAQRALRLPEILCMIFEYLLLEISEFDRHMRLLEPSRPRKRVALISCALVISGGDDFEKYTQIMGNIQFPKLRSLYMSLHAGADELHVPCMPHNQIETLVIDFYYTDEHLKQAESVVRQVKTIFPHLRTLWFVGYHPLRTHKLERTVNELVRLGHFNNTKITKVGTLKQPYYNILRALNDGRPDKFLT
ncbi:hypothetical protein BO71DRAFT_431670 [Aspergillus ellipticus CBS 707.79]|uniref:Uncharacterized protein n=1 Tax=Aspergillus ellipticus CBS 707.79 TaxID=1448320 RepID=A0A319D5M6_9EURO|nr:hypothetical protein BO71DRAFT_431670 [Aspergillus ellipticus CBS 707.79]